MDNLHLCILLISGNGCSSVVSLQIAFLSLINNSTAVKLEALLFLKNV